ncbi:TPA: hypothetical protein UL931_000224 [Stenotrophomonas maltophilia]|nr:hypothetical protein [Stenotrophomonas maltophilia]
MDCRTCTKCCRSLPWDQLTRAGKRGVEPDYVLCHNDQRRLRAPLPPVRRDLQQVRLNNTFNLWHGPVSRVLLRNAA